MRRDWTTYHKYLDLYFNDLFLKYKDLMAKHTEEINKQTRMIQRIANSKKTYINDEYIINEKKKLIQYAQEQKSRVRKKQLNLVDYAMTDVEINALTLAINKEIIVEVIKGRKYSFPLYMGSLYLKYIERIEASIIHWPKSIENHLKITAKFAPVLHAQYLAKRIGKREYFRKSKKQHFRMYEAL